MSSSGSVFLKMIVTKNEKLKLPHTIPLTVNQCRCQTHTPLLATTQAFNETRSVWQLHQFYEKIDFLIDFRCRHTGNPSKIDERFTNGEFTVESQFLQNDKGKKQPTIDWVS